MDSIAAIRLALIRNAAVSDTVIVKGRQRDLNPDVAAATKARRDSRS